jgi:hypothetical protein
LRALDPADASNPAQDITAIYLRLAEDVLQIRVDLLDFQNAKDLSLDIKIGDDASPGPVPLLIHIPSKEAPARIALDPLLATVTVDVLLSEIPSRPRVDVITPEDEITGLTVDSHIPAQTAPLLLTFYDTFAGRFPAEALRRWDGAHSGPRGARHGLKHLLEATEEHQTSLVLLDLKEAGNLSALDAMGALPKIQQMEQKALLLLPDQPEQEPLFGFSPSHFSWGGMVSRFTFVFSSEPTHLYHPPLDQRTFIPIVTENDTNQPTPDGPSLEVRRALLETALDADEEDLLVLGGSLRNSTWGSPDMVRPTLAYFASRPYIYVLSADDLLTFPAKRGKPELQSLPIDKPVHELENHYQNLTQPVLEFVANWRGSPLSSCNTDIDQDNQPECVLADEGYLVILDPQGARLTYFFSFSVAQIGREASPQGGNLRNLHQLIGPSWQVAVGLSNPSLWDLSAGEAADPGAYPGAFADADGPFESYRPAIDGNTLVFTSLDGTRTKIFSLTETGLEVEYRIQESVTTQIPLLVEPDSRFSPGWAQNYVQEKIPGGIAWGLANGPMVSLQLDDTALSLPKGALTIRAFNESLSLLAAPEDPDFDYPPGHYIPLPMAIVEVEMRDGYLLRLERLP